MPLSLKALAIVPAILWGGCIFFVGVIHLGVPSYGEAFLHAMSSVYPGFHASRTFGDVLIGTLEAAIDGAVTGVLFGWLYNVFALAASREQ